MKYNIYFKLGTIFILLVLLMIPTALIKSLIHEREGLQESAIEEVSAKWGEEQTITGPFVTIPYYKYVKETNANGSSQVVKQQSSIQVLPEELHINGQLLPEKRKRGIHEIVVYGSALTIGGKFAAINLSNAGIPDKDILWEQATVALGVSDLRGIENQVELTWNGKQVKFEPGLENFSVVSSGLQVPLQLDSTGAAYTFELNLELKGSQQLYFTPVGKNTQVHLTSTWPDPKFNGAFLPDSNEVTPNGFSANWVVLNLNRNYPQTWLGSEYRIEESAFGVDLLLPVDNYRKSYRSIQYALLFVSLTFLVFFFIEVLNKVFIHPVQYLLVGIALVVFFTLLLSISEHVPFNWAYALSAAATLLLVASYVRAILKSGMLASLITGILSILYAFIFIILQLQDYALLMGSIGLFLILAITMYYSRKIDWYNLSPKDKAPE